MGQNEKAGTLLKHTTRFGRLSQQPQNIRLFQDIEAVSRTADTDVVKDAVGRSAVTKANPAGIRVDVARATEFADHRTGECCGRFNV